MKISFRKYNFKIKEENQLVYIFDEVRKKNIILTPEEWVRQNFIHYFVYDLNYPIHKIAVEKEFKLNGLKKRFDLLVFDQNTAPLLLLECKSQKEKLTAKVLEQCLHYNLKYAVPYLAISNGEYTKAWHCSRDGAVELDHFPSYQKSTL